MIKTIRNNALSLTKRLIDAHGPRLAGSDSTKACAKDLYGELESFCDKTQMDEFFVHPGAFFGWIKIVVLGYLISVLFLWFSLPIVSIIIISISIIIMVLQFFLYLPIIDPFFKRKTGYNVYGIIEPKQKIKQQVIISGHHDSAHVFNFFVHQPKLYNLRTTGSIALVFVLLILSILYLFLPNDSTLILIGNIVLSVGILLTGQMWFFVSKKGTPGAGDNLIASTLAIEIGRYFKTTHTPLKHTRIIIVSFDAEEEGLRGARAFAKRYKPTFQSIPTTLLNIDCAYELKELFFLTKDINGSVNLSKKVAQELVEIAKEHDIESTSKPIAFLTGGTDAGELAKTGVKATTLIGMPWSNDSRSAVYHTMKDTVDRIEPEIIDAAATIFIDFIDKQDKENDQS